jgi:predicted NBD/HSP70 family sugar kinase
MHYQNTIGVDLGGTNTKLGALDASGKLRFTEHCETRSFPSPEQILAGIVAAVTEAVAVLRKSSYRILSTAFVGLPSSHPSAVKYRPADMVSQALIIQHKKANRRRQLVALPTALEPIVLSSSCAARA